MFWGCFAVLLADLSGVLGLSPGPLGVALFVGAAASILAMALLGRTSDRLGRRRFLVLPGAVFGAGIAGLAAANGYPALLAVLALLYASSGLYDVGINAAAVDLERAAGRRLMTALSRSAPAGSWGRSRPARCSRPVGTTASSTSVSSCRSSRCSSRGGRDPLPRGRRVAGGRRRGRRGGTRALPQRIFAARRGDRHFGAPIGGGDGALVRRVPAAVARAAGFPRGSGIALFYGAMAAGRLGAAAARLGERRTLLLAGLFAAGGHRALATREPILVVAGFLVVGLALSAVVPVAFSLAGDLAPRRAGAAISVVTTLGYGGFLLGPVIVGGLAELSGLRAALGTTAVAGPRSSRCRCAWPAIAARPPQRAGKPQARSSPARAANR